MKRREFINWAGLGLLASYLPVALVACSNTDTDADKADKTDNTPETKDSTEYISLGTITQLETDGYLLNQEAKAIAVKDSNGKLMALNPTCTHQGCTVDWDKDSSTLICPCHDAKFAPDGKVLAKPAPSPLPSYEVIEKNGEVLVKLA